MQATQAFVYKWIHKPTGMWYIGSRTAIGCHINDGYICSSKIVKPMIEEKPEEWERYIIETGLPGEMRKLETRLLVESNAKKNMMSFNRNNADGMPSGRMKGSVGKKHRGNEDLHPKELKKKSAKEIVDMILSEKDPIRKFLINDFMLSIVMLKPKRKKVCQTN